jgi:hypothetical protein
MKTIALFLPVVVLLTGCGDGGRDAALRTAAAGTWTTADVALPDSARVTDVATTFMPNGTWLSRYTVTRGSSTRQQVTEGTWQVENGVLFEEQTNVDGIADKNGQRGCSLIIELGKGRMVLSNAYSPNRVFLKRQ